MNLIFKGRGVDLNDRLREYASTRLTKAQRFFERIIKMEVEFSEARNPRVRNRHRVEVTLTTPGEILHAHGEGTDFFIAIDQAEERLERQVKRHKGRLIDRHRSGDGHQQAAASAAADGPADPDGATEIVRTVLTSGKPMTPEEAVIELEGQNLQFLLFTNAERMAPAVIYRRADGKFGLVEQDT